MIRPNEFQIEIGYGEMGTFVRVVHLPTGNENLTESVPEYEVGKTRDELVSKLKRLLFSPEDIRYDVGRAVDGDFIRAVHLPSGIERKAMRRDSSFEELLNGVIEELVLRELKS
ncbi:MAG: hypothetical protein KDA69_06740 [Planctomycetaceae bacterium]|nr:hypothetical protein [Planctomycetaceae bacterium]